ncbi:MAG: hypothetical protein SWN98_11390 [Pseudomonadota bacterium]|nr:hypothetical protein [Pseudomonadota bacterium]
MSLYAISLKALQGQDWTLVGSGFKVATYYSGLIDAGWGVASVVLPKSEIYPALSSGVIDYVVVSGTADRDELIELLESLDTVSYELHPDGSLTAFEYSKIVGDALDNRLSGTDAADVIFGLGGDDRLKGFAGDDELNGAKGVDLLIGGNGNDILSGGVGNDELRGNGGWDTLIGGTGNDLLLGAGGIDTLTGGRGRDVLKGGAGTDTLSGNKGADVLKGGGGGDVLNGGGGNDKLYGGSDMQRDLLNGGAGDDFVQGSNMDSLSGGGGADVFQFVNLQPGYTVDVLDFVQGDDLLDMSRTSAIDFADLMIVQGHGGTVITIDNTMAIFLALNSNDLTADDFLF